MSGVAVHHDAGHHEGDVLVKAHELTAREASRLIFGPVSLTAERGRVSLVHGRKGTGRTSLLLALTGRLRGVSGSLSVAGLDAIADPRGVRGVSSVARAGHFVDLEPRLLVGEAVVERSLIDSLKVAEGERRFDQLVELTVQDRSLHMPRDVLIEELTEAEITVLSAVLALLRPAQLVVLDDVDLGLTPAESGAVFAALARLADHEQCALVTSAAMPSPVHHATWLTDVAHLGDEPSLSEEN